MEIFWDANDPSLKTVDEEPFIGKTYAIRYPNFQTPGTKTINITLKAYSGNASSCSKSFTQSITLNASPKVGMEYLPGICLNASPRQITETSFDPNLAGTFNYTGNGVSATGVFNPAVAGVGTHTITYTYTANQAGCKDSASKEMTVWALPVPDLKLNSIPCERNNLEFTDLSTPEVGNIVKWIWNYGDGTKEDSLSTAGSTQHNFVSWKTYDVSLRVITDSGCYSIKKNLSLDVNPLPQVNFDLPQVCLPEAKAIFKNISTIPNGSLGTMTYRWNYGDPLQTNPSVSVDGIYSYRKTGTFSVTLVAISDKICVDSITKSFADIFPQPKAGFESEDSLCIDKILNLKDTSNAITGITTNWYWNLGDNGSSDKNNFTYRYANAGTYRVSLYIKTSIGCISDTAIKNISVYNYPVVDAGPDLFVLDDGQKKIQSSATGIILYYKWSPADYLSTTDSLQPWIIKPQEDKIYILTVTGRANCISTDQMKMTVLKLPKPPNTFTPNGDGINDNWVIQYLDQYPDCIVEVYTTTGNLVHRSVNYSKPWDGKYNGKDLPAGTYYYAIDPRSGRKKLAGYVTILR